MLSIAGCGYEPMYSREGQIKVAIQSFQVEGEKKLNRQIVSGLNLKNQAQLDGYKLLINTKKTLLSVSKDATGKTLTYNTTVTVVVSLIEEGDKVYKKKNFTTGFTYNNTKNKFDLSRYQRDIESNLIDTIIEQITIFLMPN